MQPPTAAEAGISQRGVWQAMTGGFKEELVALKEGAAYISAHKNRSVAPLPQQCGFLGNLSERCCSALAVFLALLPS